MLETITKRIGINLNKITNEFTVGVGITYILNHLEGSSKQKINELAEKVILDVELKNFLWEEKHVPNPSKLNNAVV
jgi:hypothetical protein